MEIGSLQVSLKKKSVKSQHNIPSMLFVTFVLFVFLPRPNNRLIFDLHVFESSLISSKHQLWRIWPLHLTELSQRIPKEITFVCQYAHRLLNADQNLNFACVWVVFINTQRILLCILIFAQCEYRSYKHD